MKQERGLVMLTHSLAIGIVGYLFLIFGMKVPALAAEKQSLILAAVSLIYMLTFGHRLPV